MKREALSNNVLVAMSGGVDSSVAAMLLKQEGMNVKGAILRMHDAMMSEADIISGKLPVSIWYAREAARRLRIDFSIIDIRQEFKAGVMEYFTSSYSDGITPNPCVYCNRHMKFPQMLKAADKLECLKVATGHYAKVEFSEETGRYVIRKGKDISKDQSYVLYRLSQEELSRIITPLGDYEKSEIRRFAEDAGLKNAKAPDSQDICFIPDGDYASFVAGMLRERFPDKQSDEIKGLMPGDFVDLNGKVLGRHKGLIHYTIGQRKGLGLSLEAPLYVCEKRTDTNEVVLGSDDDLYKNTVRAGRVNFVGYGKLPKDGLRVSARIRYSASESQGLAFIDEDGSLRVEFDTPVRAPSPGQSMVLYEGDMVVAGGIISR